MVFRPFSEYPSGLRSPELSEWTPSRTTHDACRAHQAARAAAAGRRQLPRRRPMASSAEEPSASEEPMVPSRHVPQKGARPLTGSILVGRVRVTLLKWTERSCHPLVLTSLDVPLCFLWFYEVWRPGPEPHMVGGLPRVFSSVV